MVAGDTKHFFPRHSRGERYTVKMDIFSHGLYSGGLFGRKSKYSYWLAFFFGIAPDLFSFGIFTATVWLGLVSGPDWSAGLPDPTTIPTYVHRLYDVTHSLVVFIAVFGVVWFFRRKPLWELLGWGLHIVVDIGTHSLRFFPTPFLWPISDYSFDGWPWSSPEIFIPNVIILIAIYGSWWYSTKKKRTST